MATNKKETGILTDKVDEMACSKCGCRIDTSQLKSFIKVECPDCGSIETVPAKLGSFLLLRLLGTGGMGGVYLARDEALGRDVGIKVMLKSLGEDKKFIETFKHEARAVAKLNHPNIAQIYSFGKEKGQPYIVMELVSGERLDKMLDEQKQLKQGVVLRIMYDITMGLSAADEAGLVHGDIKPENILLDEKGHAKLVDFGLASGAHQAVQEGIWGTPYYIAPEKVKRKKVDARSDMYSLGATIYHVLAGVPPFDGDTPIEVVKARLTTHPPNLRLARSDIHPLVENMIRRLLQVEPFKRHPNYASLLGDIRKALQEVNASRSNGKRFKLSKKKSSRISSDSGSLSTSGKLPRTAKFTIRKDIAQSTHIADHIASDTPKKPTLTPEEKAKKKQARKKTIRRLVIVLSILLLIGGAIGAFFHITHQKDLEIRQRREFLNLRDIRNSATKNYTKLTLSVSNTVSLVEKTRLFVEDVAEAVEFVTGASFVADDSKLDVFIPGVDKRKSKEPPPPEEKIEEEDIEAETPADATTEKSTDGNTIPNEEDEKSKEEIETTEPETEPELVPEEEIEEEFFDETLPPDDPIVIAANKTVEQVRMLKIFADKTKPVSDEAFAEKNRILHKCKSSKTAITYANNLAELLKKAYLIEQRAKLAYKIAVKSRSEVLSLRTAFEKEDSERKIREDAETEKLQKEQEEERKQQEYENKKASEIQQADTTRQSLKLLLGQNSFQDAINDIKTAMTGIETKEGKAAFANLLENYEYLLAMKTILTESINKTPFHWGWGAGHSARDILKVTRRGIMVKGRSKPYEWKEVSIAQMLKMVDHYLKDRNIKARIKAKLAFGAAVYCNEFESEGAKKKAKLYINKALDNGFSRRTQERLVPAVW